MHSDAQISSVSKKMLWTSYIISVLPSLFLLLNGVMKLVKPAPVVEATLQLDYPENTIVGMGIVLLVSTILYLIPRTAVLGAITVDGLSRRRCGDARSRGRLIV